jgi:hypothetical protein
MSSVSVAGAIPAAYLTAADAAVDVMLLTYGCCCCYCYCCCCCQVVWDDSMARMFVLPTASRPLGLLYRANRAQVDFDSPTGAARGVCLGVCVWNQCI